jgi:hypothetical protein
LRRTEERAIPWRLSYVVAIVVFLLSLFLEKQDPGNPLGVLLALIGVLALIVLVIREKRRGKGEGS